MSAKAHNVFKYLRHTANALAKDVGSATATQTSSIPAGDAWQGSQHADASQHDASSLCKAPPRISAHLSSSGSARSPWPTTPPPRAPLPPAALISHPFAAHSYPLHFTAPPPPPPRRPQLQLQQTQQQQQQQQLPIHQYLQQLGAVPPYQEEAAAQSSPDDGHLLLAPIMKPPPYTKQLLVGPFGIDFAPMLLGTPEISTPLGTESHNRKQQQQQRDKADQPEVSVAESSIDSKRLQLKQQQEEQHHLLGDPRPGVSRQQKQQLQGADRGSGSARKPSRASSSSVMLNKEIMAAGSARELLALVRGKGHHFDFFNVSSAISRTPKLLAAWQPPLLSGCPPEGSPSPARQQQQQQQHTGPGHLERVGRELAVCLAGRMCDRMHQFDARGLANSAWAFAKLRYIPNPNLPGLIATAAAKKMDAFGAQNISNLAWAFVYMHHRDEHVLELMAKQVVIKLDEFKPQELSNVLWAFASLEFLDSAMVHAATGRAALMAAQFKEQELSNVIWAMGRLQFYSPAVFSRLLSEAKRKMHLLQPQGISNIAWAMAALGHRDGEAMSGMAAAVSAHGLPAYDAQALAHLAWAFSVLGFNDAPLLDAMVTEALSREERMQPHQLAVVLASRAAMGPVVDSSLLSSWACQVASRLSSCEDSHAAASLASSLETLTGGIQGRLATALGPSSATGDAVPAAGGGHAEQKQQQQQTRTVPQLVASWGLPADLDGPWHQPPAAAEEPAQQQQQAPVPEAPQGDGLEGGALHCRLGMFPSYGLAESVMSLPGWSAQALAQAGAFAPNSYSPVDGQTTYRPEAASRAGAEQRALTFSSIPHTTSWASVAGGLVTAGGGGTAAVAAAQGSGIGLGLCSSDLMGRYSTEAPGGDLYVLTPFASGSSSMDADAEAMHPHASSASSTSSAATAPASASRWLPRQLIQDMGLDVWGR